MPSINVFIGGTGVKSAALMRRRADFYGHEIRDVFAIDTDPEPEAAERRILGKNLVLSDVTFKQALQQEAARLGDTNWSSMFIEQDGRREPYSLTVLRAASDTVHANLTGGVGLYTLRGAGWLAFGELERKNPEFIGQLAAAVQRAATGLPQGERAIIHVVASIAGGTGSGLFLPLVAALRRALSNQLELAAQRRYEVHLALVAPSAFDATWQGHEDETTLRSRGFSGAFAAFREIEWLCRPPDPMVDPFEVRPIRGYELPPVFDRVYWLGRRSSDADAGAEATFNEASRTLALLNDDLVARQIAGPLPGDPYTLLPSLALIEYPKLEIARSMAARSAGELLQELREAHGDTRTPILDKEPSKRGAFVRFIQEQRQPHQVLESSLTAQNNRIDQDRVTSDRGIYATLGLRTTLSLVERGEQRAESSYYAPSQTDWLSYVGEMHKALANAEQQDLRRTESELEASKIADEAYVMEAAAAAIQEVDERTGRPSLGAARTRLMSLVETLNVARQFFHRGFTDAIAAHGDLPIRDVSEQARRAADAEEALAGPIEPVPPEGFIYSWFVSIVPLAVAFLAALSLLTRLLPPPLYWVWLIPEPLVGVARPPTFAELLVAFVLGAGLFVAHRVWVDRSGKTVPEVRRELETRWIEEWEWLVICKQVQVLWRVAERLTVDLLFVSETAASRAQGTHAFEPDAPVGRFFALIEKADRWLDELRGFAQGRAEAARIPYPQTVRWVGSHTDVPITQVRTVWPPLKLNMVLSLTGIGGYPDDLQFVPGDPFSLLPAKQWAPPAERSDQQKKDLGTRGLAFLEAIEDEIQRGIVDRNILAGDLESALGREADFNSPAMLALQLDELVRTANNRGAPGEFDVPPKGAGTYFVVPTPAVAGKVNEAIQLALGSPSGQFTHLTTSLPDPGTGLQEWCLVSRHVGEAIALLQFRQYAWPDEEGAHLLDIERARRQHYAEGGTRGGDPQLHHDYNATNTEFYLLPELSSAAQLEVARGLTNRVPRLLVPRLYGSDLRVDTMPSLLDLFYLADVRGLLVKRQEASHMRGERSDWDETWYLLEQPTDVGDAIREGRAVPLVTYAFIGAALPGGRDPLADARRRVIVFDAFVAAMSHRGGPLADHNVPRFRVHEARVPYSQWGEPAVAASLSRVRMTLVEEWRRLAVNDGTSTYDLMAKRALEDASQMAEPHRRFWKDICELQFARSCRNLHIDWIPERIG